MLFYQIVGEKKLLTVYARIIFSLVLLTVNSEFIECERISQILCVIIASPQEQLFCDSITRAATENTKKIRLWFK